LEELDMFYLGESGGICGVFYGEILSPELYEFIFGLELLLIFSDYAFIVNVGPEKFKLL
jgi:hypothetical protein